MVTFLMVFTGLEIDLCDVLWGIPIALYGFSPVYENGPKGPGREKPWKLALPYVEMLNSENLEPDVPLKSYGHGIMGATPKVCLKFPNVMPLGRGIKKGSQKTAKIYVRIV